MFELPTRTVHGCFGSRLQLLTSPQTPLNFSITDDVVGENPNSNQPLFNKNCVVVRLSAKKTTISWTTARASSNLFVYSVSVQNSTTLTVSGLFRWRERVFFLKFSPKSRAAIAFLEVLQSGRTDFCWNWSSTPKKLYGCCRILQGFKKTLLAISRKKWKNRQ